MASDAGNAALDKIAFPVGVSGRHGKYLITDNENRAILLVIRPWPDTSSHESARARAHAVMDALNAWGRANGRAQAAEFPSEAAAESDPDLEEHEPGAAIARARDANADEQFVKALAGARFEDSAQARADKGKGRVRGRPTSGYAAYSNLLADAGVR